MNARFTYEDVAHAALGEPAKREGAEILYRCPRPERHTNGDVHPSLKVNTRKDTWACFVCGASGTAWALAAFVSRVEPGDKQAVKVWLQGRGLVNGKSEQVDAGGPKKSKRMIVATYDYADEKGTLLHCKDRWEPKGFSQRRPDGNGGWIGDLKGVRRVLYRLPEVTASEDVLVVEGEKDADTARERLDLCGTTGGSAADKWLDEYTAALAGKDVVVIPDADEPGRKKARIICQALSAKARSVRLLELPGAKDLTEWVEHGGTADALVNLVANTQVYNSEVMDGAQLLDDLAAYIRRFVSLSESQTRVAAAWVVHTHTFNAADATPYLAITSAEKQSGKTRLLEVLETLVENPWFTGRVTAAVLTRKIDANRPALLLDESDAAFGGEKEYAETLRGVLNTGHRRGGTSSCCAGQGANITTKDFSTFSPKAIAGIGKLPDTVADRAVPIRLKRAAQGERVERFRRRDIESDAARLKAQIEAWGGGIVSMLRDARPELPEELTDRQQDGAEPLLAIADAAGGAWPQALRRSLVALCAEAQVADSSIRVQLLKDVQQVFDARGIDRFASVDLAAALYEIETSPWAEWSHGKPITPGKLARLLSSHDIKPHSVRIGDKTPKGYQREDFEDAWARYLRIATVTSPHPANESATAATPFISLGIESKSKRNVEDDVADQNSQKPASNGPCGGVAFSGPPTGGKRVVEVEV